VTSFVDGPLETREKKYEALFDKSAHSGISMKNLQ
jgi:hypothetical protein